MNLQDLRSIRSMSNNPRERSAFESYMRAREIVTVRCSFCQWSHTGPARHTSSRGRENGALERGRRHAETHRKRAR